MVLLDACLQAESWRQVLTWRGDIENNPLLVKPKCFGAFLVEFRVARRIRKGRIEELRGALRTCLPAVVPTGDGDRLVALAKQAEIRSHTYGVEVSLISKVAAFVAPTRFFPTDSTNRRGLAKLGYREQVVRDYAEHLRRMESSRSQHGDWLGEQLRGFIPRYAASDEIGWILYRLIDVWLMRLGTFDRNPARPDAASRALDIDQGDGAQNG